MNGGRRVGAEEKGALEDRNTENASFWLHIRIMLRTIGIVLFGDALGSAGQSKLAAAAKETIQSTSTRRFEVQRPGTD
jgi:hypothetical protein